MGASPLSVASRRRRSLSGGGHPNAEVKEIGLCSSSRLSTTRTHIA